MTRDKDLLKAILTQVHALPFGEELKELRWPSQPTDEELCEHVRLLKDAGLVEAVEVPDYRKTGGWGVRIIRLTSAGHDFVENAANEQAWKEASQRAGKFGLKVFTEVLGKVATELAFRSLPPFA